MSERSELLAPAGDFQTALAAFEAGADAVYCGLADFSARAFATNFTFEELENLLAVARRSEKKVYVTFNTLLDEDLFDGAIETLARLEDLRPDGVIVQDLGVAKLIRDNFPSLALHASTQLVAHNLEGVLALKDLGFVRVVLARELSIEEISSIAKRCGGMELEVFIHGALCYSLSGLCLFGAMEKGRSGNRGKCPYCCRQSYDGRYPFSMKDLRVGQDVRKLVEAGVVSLKIEGRMKSPLYVASVTKYYRSILDGAKPSVSVSDLETVFSRRTTQLYLNGKPTEDVIDPDSLGHLGTPIGVVKKVTRDREGFAWLRFHTSRALEKHDGLQFDAVDENGKHFGMAIREMRQAISRRLVFEVNAGVDVEILLDETIERELKPGMKIYCSMSNAVKRRFPTPSYRPSDYPGILGLDVIVTISKDKVTARDDGFGGSEVSIEGRFEPAKNPDKTRDAAQRAFSKLGGTRCSLRALRVEDPERLFVPTSVLNDLRRDLVEKLDALRENAIHGKIERAQLEDFGGAAECVSKKRVKVRLDQPVPPGAWDEVIVVVEPSFSNFSNFADLPNLRLALPVYTSEPAFNKLRSLVKRLVREGYAKWECADLSTLRLLKQVGVTDITADWTLYAFNQRALAELSALGVKRFVASPENSRENLQYLAESGYDVEFLVQQSTPLFMSLTKPVGDTAGLQVYERSGLWVTIKPAPRTFELPEGVSTRLDVSYDAR